MGWIMKAEKVAETRMAHEPDFAEVRRAVQVFCEPDAHLFLQTFPSKKWAVKLASDADGICDVVRTWNDCRSFFFAVNPCKPLTEPAKDGDILRRRWFFIDIDRNKTLQPEDPATDQEHADVLELAQEIVAYLDEAGFPAPIQVDSGNGYHLYYRIDLPNDAESKAIVREALHVLDNTFSDHRGDVGAECHDARRLARMPGTWSRRGKKSTTRPYRMAKFVDVPETIGMVSKELLERLAGREPAAAEPTAEPEKKKIRCRSRRQAARHARRSTASVRYRRSKDASLAPGLGNATTSCSSRLRRSSSLSPAGCWRSSK